VLLFLFVVGLGAPLLAGGRGGLSVFFGPSAGFILGWVPGAYVCGLLMHGLARLPVFPAALLASIGGGIVVVYALGIPVLAWKADLSLVQAMIGSTVFIPGDLLKAAAAAFVCEAARRGAVLAGRA
jgi:biotin transport system substrate-specific component